MDGLSAAKRPDLTPPTRSMDIRPQGSQSQAAHRVGRPNCFEACSLLRCACHINLQSGLEIIPSERSTRFTLPSAPSWSDVRCRCGTNPTEMRDLVSSTGLSNIQAVFQADADRCLAIKMSGLFLVADYRRWREDHHSSTRENVTQAWLQKRVDTCRLRASLLA